MNRLFSIEGPVWSFFSKLGSAFLLSILWTITSIPIFTIGASNAAIYYVMLKILDEKDVKTVKEYFKAFKSNFKRATAIWVPLFLFILIGLADIYICLVLGGTSGYGGAVVFMCLEIILVLFSIYVFPLIGRFENTFKQTVKNGFLMPIKHYFVSLWIIAVICGVVALGFVFPPITIFLPGVMTFAVSYPMYYVFKKYTEEDIDPIEGKIFNKNKKVNDNSNQNLNDKNSNSRNINNRNGAGQGKTNSKNKLKPSKKDNVF